MIENKLEQLLNNPNRLGAEFDLEQLSKSTETLEKQLDSIKTFFIDNICLLADYELIHDKIIYIDEMIQLSIVYAYYFGLDYLYRKEHEASRFNYEFVRKSVTDAKDSLRVEKIFENVYKSYPKLKNSSISLKDTLHYNPELIRLDLENSTGNTSLESHFSGQILKYLQKIFSVDFSLTTAELTSVEFTLSDVLPALSIMMMNASTLIPMGKYVGKGSYNINKIRNLCKNLCYNQPKIKDDVELSPDFVVPTDSKFPESLYDMAREDLFHIIRLSNTVNLFHDFTVDYADIPDKQKLLLQTFYSLYYHMPSVVFQYLYKDNVKNACYSYISEKQIDLLKQSFPIINLNSIVFPQVLLILLYALFTDGNLQIHEDNRIKTTISDIEEYIDRNYDKISEHFVLPEVFVWDNDNYISTHKRNKGYRKTKNNKTIPKINTEYTFDFPNSDLCFEDVARIIMSSEPRWRYTNITEENAIDISILQQPNNRSLGNHRRIIKGENEEELLLLRYTSEEYSIKLYNTLLHTLNLNDDNIDEILKKIEPVPNPFHII